MDGPVRRVVKYNLITIEKGVGWSTIVCGKGVRLESDCIREKDPPISKYQRGNSAWVSLPDFSIKGEPYCSICNENFRKFLNKY